MTRETSTPAGTKPPPTTAAEYPHPIAFSIQIGRNLVVQALGLGMVSLVGLGVLPWPLVLGWTLVVAAAVVAEHRMLRFIAENGRASRTARIGAPALRLVTTTIYAAAALALLLKGGPAETLFAFALISASLVHVLMRHYRSPTTLLLSISPYLVVLLVVGFGLTRTAIEQGRGFAALAAGFAIAMFAVQFWSARAQLAGAWAELSAAREGAEERERAAQASNRAKSQFLTNMSHELRTPLHGVLGMAQALGRDPLTPAQQQRVSVIIRSGESLLSVLNDLLDLSKIEAGSLKLEPVEFDLEHLVRGVAAAYQPQAAKKGLTFDFEVADEVRGRYRGDSARLRRVLYSLCDNAVKFTKTGGAALSVARDGDRLVFGVADTGIGIAQSDRARLFEGFFQADATLARQYCGGGIGLAICGKLTSLMGGRIDVLSELGCGSIFSLTLPLERIEVQTARPVSAAERKPSELRVLAAEDNLTNQLVLKTMLEPAGIAPTMVINGRDALAAWERQNWDIVLMDIQMPEMNGVEATRAIRLRELQTGRPRTPIVAVTANAMTHQLVEYRAVGIDGVVAKPVDLTNLYQVMESALA